MMQSTQQEYFNDPALLALLQSLGNQTSLGRQQDDQQHTPEQSIESILQQVQLLQAFQELSQIQQQNGLIKDGGMQAEVEEEGGQRYGDDNSDQNTQQGQQNLPHALALPEEEISEKEIGAGKEKKRDTISILGMDPSAQASLCQEIFNSLISAAATAGQQQSLSFVPSHNPLLPLVPSAYPINNTTNFQVENPQQQQHNVNTSNEMQLFQFLQSCLTLDQIASAAVAAVSSTSNPHQHINNSNESSLTHKKHVQVLQTPTSSMKGFKSTNETTHNQSQQQWSASNSLINMRTSNDISILQSVNANLNAQFNRSVSPLETNYNNNSHNKSTSISATPPKFQNTFVPTILSYNFQLEGFESLDSLAAAQLSLQALLASGLNDPNLLRLQHQKRLERQFKIERYKNKRRNWIRKISYDCRKRVADSRLRVKGRFISKKDTQNIKPTGAEESSYQTDHYAQNSIFSDQPKQNNSADMHNAIVLSKYNQNADKKSDGIRQSSGSCIAELNNASSSKRKNRLASPSMIDAIKQRIQMKKPIFAFRIHKKQSPKDNNIFPTPDIQCLPLLENQIPTSSSSSKTLSSNEQFSELQTPV